MPPKSRLRRRPPQPHMTGKPSSRAPAPLPGTPTSTTIGSAVTKTGSSHWRRVDPSLAPDWSLSRDQKEGREIRAASSGLGSGVPKEAGLLPWLGASWIDHFLALRPYSAFLFYANIRPVVLGRVTAKLRLLGGTLHMLRRMASL